MLSYSELLTISEGISGHICKSNSHCVGFNILCFLEHLNSGTYHLQDSDVACEIGTVAADMANLVIKKIHENTLNRSCSLLSCCLTCHVLAIACTDTNITAIQLIDYMTSTMHSFRPSYLQNLVERETVLCSFKWTLHYFFKMFDKGAFTSESQAIFSCKVKIQIWTAWVFLCLGQTTNALDIFREFTEHSYKDMLLSDEIFFALRKFLKSIVHSETKRALLEIVMTFIQLILDTDNTRLHGRHLNLQLIAVNICNKMGEWEKSFEMLQQITVVAPSFKNVLRKYEVMLQLHSLNIKEAKSLEKITKQICDHPKFVLYRCVKFIENLPRNRLIVVPEQLLTTMWQNANMDMHFSESYFPLLYLLLAHFLMANNYLHAIEFFSNIDKTRFKLIPVEMVEKICHLLDGHIVELIRKDLFANALYCLKIQDQLLQLLSDSTRDFILLQKAKVLRTKAFCFSKLNHLDEFKTAIEEAQRHENSPWNFFLIFYVALKCQNFEEAIANVYKIATSEHPQAAEIIMLAGKVARQENGMEFAIQILNASVDIHCCKRLSNHTCHRGCFSIAFIAKALVQLILIIFRG